MRPTWRMSPVPAMPMTSVAKIKGAMIDLIRLRKRIDRGRNAVPYSGQSQPMSTPMARPMKIFCVRETFGSAMWAKCTRLRYPHETWLLSQPPDPRRMFRWVLVRTARSRRAAGILVGHRHRQLLHVDLRQCVAGGDQRGARCLAGVE